MVSPHPMQALSCIGRFFVAIQASKEKSFMEIMEWKLKGDNWQIMKQKEEARKSAINSVFASPEMKMFLQHYLSD